MIRPKITARLYAVHYYLLFTFLLNTLRYQALFFSCNERRFFWIRWDNGTIQVGSDSLYENAFLSWKDEMFGLIEGVMVESAADVSAIFDFVQEEGEYNSNYKINIIVAIVKDLHVYTLCQ